MGIHAVRLWGIYSDVVTILFSRILLGYLSYSGGVLFYITRFPERFFPGKFDYFGSSHQIWHCFVNMGAYFVYSGILAYISHPEHLVCPNIGLSEWD